MSRQTIFFKLEKKTLIWRNILAVLNIYRIVLLTLELSGSKKVAEFANSVDLAEVAHNEPPHLDLHCLPSCL